MILSDKDGHAVSQLNKGVTRFRWQHITHPGSHFLRESQGIKIGYVQLFRLGEARDGEVQYHYD
jgi:hypothetical protein